MPWSKSASSRLQRCVLQFFLCCCCTCCCCRFAEHTLSAPACAVPLACSVLAVCCCAALQWLALRLCRGWTGWSHAWARAARRHARCVLWGRSGRWGFGGKRLHLRAGRGRCSSGQVGWALQHSCCLAVMPALRKGRVLCAVTSKLMQFHMPTSMMSQVSFSLTTCCCCCCRCAAA